MLEVLQENNKKKRNVHNQASVKFAYRNNNNNNDASNHKIIKEPEILKEQCVPNITKICMSLYVFCESALFTDFDNPQEKIVRRDTEVGSTYMWPWVAKIFIDGVYKCSGVLIDPSWVLVSHSCLRDSM